MNDEGTSGNISAETVPSGADEIGRVYFVTDGEFIKIGYSNEPKSRMNSLRSGNPRTLRLLGVIPGTLAIEKSLHQRFAHLEVRREWFKDNRHEIINLIEQLVRTANPNGPMPLLPYTQDIEAEHAECSLYMRYEFERIGTREHRQNTLRHRIYTDLIHFDGGSDRQRDVARDLFAKIENGTHPLMKGADKPWPPEQRAEVARRLAELEAR